MTDKNCTPTFTPSIIYRGEVEFNQDLTQRSKDLLIKSFIAATGFESYDHYLSALEKYKNKPYPKKIQNQFAKAFEYGNVRTSDDEPVHIHIAYTGEKEAEKDWFFTSPFVLVKKSKDKIYFRACELLLVEGEVQWYIDAEVFSPGMLISRDALSLPICELVAEVTDVSDLSLRSVKKINTWLRKNEIPEESLEEFIGYLRDELNGNHYSSFLNISNNVYSGDDAFIPFEDEEISSDKV